MMKKAAVVLLIFVFAFASGAVTLAPAKSPLSLRIYADASFDISVDGVKWLTSGPLKVFMWNQWMTPASPSATNTKGQDSLGTYTEHRISWTIQSYVHWETAFRVYDGQGIITFEQYYPWGMNATRTPDGTGVSSAFPSFQVDGQCNSDLGFVSYGGEFLESNTGRWCKDSDKIYQDMASGPLVVFNSQYAAVISPLDSFMDVSQRIVNGSLAYGFAGWFEVLMPSSRMRTILALSDTVTNAVMNWGSILLKFHGKQPSIAGDMTLRTLGYYTDNGAYYYYNTEPNTSYEDTLLGVYNYSKSAKIPYQYIQLDSWWYFKGANNGVKNWTAMPEVFPHGLEWFFEQTGWPVVGHNRYWSNQTTYANRNGGQFGFDLFSNGYALPDDPKFWPYLLGNARKWGLVVYEQDWLDTTSDHTPSFQWQPGIAATWLESMGEAAESHGLTIQYCMPYCRHALQSVSINAVNQIRASDDYQPGNDQWQIGVSSLLAWALGLAPSKDNFWTTTVQPGSPSYKGHNTEPYPELESCVATYSMGPVGPADRINLTNVDLVMKSCRTDGVLLRPSRPLIQVQAAFIQQAFGSGGPQGHVWSTYTEIESFYWAHLFAADLSAAYSVDADGLGVSGTMVTFSHNNPNGTIQQFDNSHPISLPVCGRKDFQLWHTAPVFSNGYALLGELDKWVPVSSQRFSNFEVTPTGFSVRVSGGVYEPVVVSVAKKSSTGNSWTIQPVYIMTDFGGVATLHYPQ